MYKNIFNTDLQKCDIKTIQYTEQSIYKFINNERFTYENLFNKITSSYIFKKLINPIYKQNTKNIRYNNLYTLIEDYKNNYIKVKNNVNFLINIDCFSKYSYYNINNTDDLNNTKILCNITETLSKRDFLNHIILYKNSNIYIIKINKNMKKRMKLIYNKNGYIQKNTNNFDKIYEYIKFHRLNYAVIDYNTFNINYHYNKYIKYDNMIIKNDYIKYIKQQLDIISNTKNKKLKIYISHKIYKYMYNNKYGYFLCNNFNNIMLIKIFMFSIYNVKYYKIIQKMFNYFLKHNIITDNLIIFRYIFNKVYNIQDNINNERLINNIYYKKYFDESISKYIIPILSYKNIRILSKLLGLDENQNFCIYNKIHKNIKVLETNSNYVLKLVNINSPIINELNEYISCYNDINDENDLIKYINEFITIQKNKSNLKENEERDIIKNEENYYTKNSIEPCKICFDDTDTEKVHVKCNDFSHHIYCIPCCIKWFSSNNNCPYCRKNIELNLYELYNIDIFSEIFSNDNQNQIDINNEIIYNSEYDTDDNEDDYYYETDDYYYDENDFFE